MKKSNFVAMIMGTVGGILFAIGMCMCLLPEWETLTPGVVLGSIGVAELLATWILTIPRSKSAKFMIASNG